MEVAEADTEAGKMEIIAALRRQLEAEKAETAALRKGRKALEMKLQELEAEKGQSTLEMKALAAEFAAAKAEARLFSERLAALEARPVWAAEWAEEAAKEQAAGGSACCRARV